MGRNTEAAWGSLRVELDRVELDQVEATPVESDWADLGHPRVVPALGVCSRFAYRPMGTQD